MYYFKYTKLYNKFNNLKYKVKVNYNKIILYNNKLNKPIKQPFISVYTKMLIISIEKA